MKKHFQWAHVGLLFAFIGFSIHNEPAKAQSQSRVLVVQAEHATSPPLREMPMLPPPVGAQQVIPLRHPHAIQGLPFQTRQDAAVQTSVGPLVSTTPTENFLGVGVGLGSITSDQYAPPDTNGAAGPKQFVQWVNVSFAAFDKATGGVVYGPAAGNTLWQALGGACASNNSGDPIAQFDQQAQRWVMMQPVFKSPYSLCVAVSNGPDWAAANFAWNLYSFAIPTGQFPDYPKLAVWTDGYYVTYNQFQGNSFVGAAACVMDRTSMLLGKAASMQCPSGLSSSDASLLPAHLDGDSGASGTSQAPPAGSPEYFLEIGPTDLSGNGSTLDLWKLHVNWTNSNNTTLTGPVSISVTPFVLACGGGSCIPQSQTSQQLDSLGDRLMYRLAYRNFGSHESLVATHSVNLGGGNTGVRWYEIQSPGATPTVAQQSTWSNSNLDSNYRWMGSLAADKAGDMALGYSVSSGSMHPAIRYTGRLASDPASTMESEASIVEGGGSQLNNLNRWGDYASMAIDPVDDCTFWFTTEFLMSNGTFNWSTEISSFNFGSAAGCSNPEYSVTASPSIQSAAQGSTSNYTLNAGGLNGYSGTISFTVSGLPPGASVGTINPITLSSSSPAGSTTLAITSSASTPVGTYTLSVTGSDGTLASLTPIMLGVTAGASPSFSVTASPSSQTVNQGSGTSYTVNATPANGFTGSVSLGVSGLPSGANGSFSPNPVSITGTSSVASTLSVTTSSSTPAGTYTLTITGTSGSLTSSTKVTLVVNSVSTGSFTVSASPSSETVKRPANASYTVTVTPSGGFTGSVSLSVSGLPARSSASFSTNPVSITGSSAVSSTLTVNTNKRTQTGTFTLTITGTSGASSSSTSASLTVQ